MCNDLAEAMKALDGKTISVQRQMALARSFIKPERQLHFENSRIGTKGKQQKPEKQHTKHTNTKK